MATILIANGDHKFGQIVSKILVAYHHDVVTARTGEEALQLWQSRQPALVLLDLCLLGLHGLDVLAKIRAHAPDLPVVVLTGEVSVEIEDKARELGVTDVLRKRLKMNVIMEAVNHALQRVPKAQPGRPPKPTTSQKPVTVLIVDDEKEIRELLQEFLETKNYSVKVAANGEEALTLALHERPDLVLMDIYMPGLNGVEVLRRLIASRFMGGVIMLTASQDEALLKTALDLGAFDVLSKPVNLKEVELALMVKSAMQEQET